MVLKNWPTMLKKQMKFITVFEIEKPAKSDIIAVYLCTTGRTVVSNIKKHDFR